MSRNQEMPLPSPGPNGPAPGPFEAPAIDRPDFMQRYHEMLGGLVRLADRSARWSHAQLHGALEEFVDRALHRDPPDFDNDIER